MKLILQPLKGTLGLLLVATSITLLSWWFFSSFIKTPSKSPDEFTTWLNDEDNRCICSRMIGGVRVSVKYYPPQYADRNMRKAGAEVGSSDSHVRKTPDSSRTLTFLMTFSPDEATSENLRASSIMREGVGNQEEFVERVMNTNFFMDENVKLYADGVPNRPLLCVLENLYELSDSRSFLVVYGLEGIDAVSDFVFQYDDKIFGIGKVQFPFPASAIRKANSISITR